MILIVDLSPRPGSLSCDEFVTPVRRIVREEGYLTRIRHYTGLSRADIASSDGAILCGTALADFGYLEGLERFTWLPSFPGPVLGICAGMQVLTEAYGGDVYPAIGIGMAGQQVVAPDPLLAGKDRFMAYESPFPFGGPATRVQDTRDLLVRSPGSPSQRKTDVRRDVPPRGPERMADPAVSLLLHAFGGIKGCTHLG